MTKSAIGAGLLIGAGLVLSFQNCSRTLFEQGPPPAPITNNSLSSLLCSAGATTGAAVRIYPTSCLVAQALPANSLGLEMNDNYLLVPTKDDPNIFLLPADDQVNGTPQDRTLYVELATYAAADTFIVSAESVTGDETELLNICNLSTWDKGDNTGGVVRPQSDTLLQFVVHLPKGTQNMKFDFSNAHSPTYFGIWNLVDFHAALSNPATNPYSAVAPSNPKMFRVQNALPEPLNDNVDTDTANANLCP